jgi:hypothetical protein
MNVSLTPNDTLGRMLHTFQCTAYEVADYTFENLVDLKLISILNHSTIVTKIGQVKFEDLIKYRNWGSDSFNKRYPLFSNSSFTGPYGSYVLYALKGLCFYSASITHAYPGSRFVLRFSSGHE